MLMDIFASILQPSGGGEYRVIVSAYRSDPDHSIGMYPNRKGMAATSEEAEALANRLIADLRAELEGKGHRINAVTIRK